MNNILNDLRHTKQEVLKIMLRRGISLADTPDPMFNKICEYNRYVVEDIFKLNSGKDE